MRSDVGRIGDGRFMIGVDGKLAQYSVEHTSGVPPREFGMHRLPRAEPFGQVTPRHARLGDEEHGIHEVSIR